MPEPARKLSIAPLHASIGLRAQACEAIRTAIMRMDIYGQPEEIRLDERQLCQDLGVSRTPIREALARLESAGLVETKPGRHTVVSRIDVRAVREAQSVVAAMHELAVREAALAMRPDDIEAMRVANECFAEALHRMDVDAALAADDAFHAVAVDVGANRAVRAVLDQFTPALRRVERLRFGSLSGRDSIAQHASIVILCTAGDADTAAAMARANWLTLTPVFQEM